jgi:hypothetical protein
MHPARSRYSLLALAWLLPSLASAQVVINEIMYAPLAPEPEWIELFNAGPTAVDVGGWTVQDAGATKRTIPPAVIPSGGYLLLTKDTTKLLAIRLIASPMLQFSLPSLNNSGDIVALRDGASRTIDSLRYASAWGGNGGISLERRFPSALATADTSWGNSTSPTGATPGKKNSLSPAERNISILGIGFDARQVAARVLLGNTGSATAAGAKAVLYYDADGDGIGSAAEELSHRDLSSIDAGDSLLLSLAWTRPLTDRGEAGIVEIAMTGDERTEDNAASFLARDEAADSGVVVNEIMFDPLDIAGESGAEYIELHNRSSRMVMLAGWQIEDGSHRVQALLPVQDLPPGGYVVIAGDSTLYGAFPNLRDSTNVILTGSASLSLNNDEDDIVLRNASGTPIDSVHYSGSWHRSGQGGTKGIALERISAGGSSTDRRNWSSSVASPGGTPGSINSISIPVTASDATLAVSPETISPDGDGFEDFARVTYRLPSTTSRIIVDLYDRRGHHVRQIASNEGAGAEGELILDGYDDAGRPLAPGIYLLRLESYDEGGTGLTIARATVVIARKL